MPFASVMTLTPGICAALVQSEVFSHPLGSPSGRIISTVAASFPWQRVMSLANSSTLAREQGHCGCMKTTRVGSPIARRTWLEAGQVIGACAGAPAAPSYFHSRAMTVRKRAPHTAKPQAAKSADRNLHVFAGIARPRAHAAAPSPPAQAAPFSIGEARGWLYRARGFLREE